METNCISKKELIDFVKENDFAFCYNAGRDVCNTVMDNYELCVAGIIESIEKANCVEEADEATKGNFSEDAGCTIYQAGDVDIAYYE